MTNSSSPAKSSVLAQPRDNITGNTMPTPSHAPVQPATDTHNSDINVNLNHATIDNKTDPNAWCKRARRKTSRVNYAEDSFDEKPTPKEEVAANKNKGSSMIIAASTKSTKPPKITTSQRKVLRNSTSQSSSATPPSASSSSSKLPSLDFTSSSSKHGSHDQEESNINERIPSNWQPRSISSDRLTGILDFEDSVINPDGRLYLSDGSNYGPGDHVYMVSEPPGEPYYIGRIMEFVDRTKPSSALPSKTEDDQKLTANKSDSVTTRRNSITGKSIPNYSVRVNWLYRPKDISRKSTDSRLLYVTMHSDVCPLISIRGHCSVMHKDNIEDFDKYRAKPNNFWFDKFYDRYILRFFDVVPTQKMINLPTHVAKVLCERFSYVLVEVGKAKELCESPKNCVKCSQWCSPEDSVQCAHCQNHYHMLCVDPPLTRKPSRGFGWSCASCSRALEVKMRQEKGYSLEDEEELNVDVVSATTPVAVTTEDNTEAATSRENSTSLSRYEELDRAFAEKASRPLDAAQIHQLKMWPFRYLGIHSKIEDVLDADDRIYPRAVSRLGTKHQANIADWPGRPVIYYESEKKGKRGYNKARRGNTTPTPAAPIDDTTPNNHMNTTETSSNVNTRENSPIPDSLLMTKKKDRPAWFQEKPTGYIERGGDTTSSLMWKEPVDEATVDEFLKKTEPFAAKLQLAPNSPNFVDACLKALLDFEYDHAKALKMVATFTRKSLKEPTFTKEEKLRFEEAVKKYGSELHPVYKEVKTKKSADIVRYYYLWKKTPSGHKIWDNFEGRKKKKQTTTTTASTTSEPSNSAAETQSDKKDPEDLVEDVADSADDSAYDSTKAKNHKRTFMCKHCATTTSRIWKRAPGHAIALADEDNEDGTPHQADMINSPIMALCMRCARLWRRYAVVWEEPEEVMKKVTQKGGNGWKRKLEEELIEDARQILAEKEKNKDKTRATKRQKMDKSINNTAALSEQPSSATKQSEKLVKVNLPISTPSLPETPVIPSKKEKEKKEKPAKENAKEKIKVKILVSKEKEIQEKDKSKSVPIKEKETEKKVRIKKEDKTKSIKSSKITAETKSSIKVDTDSSDNMDSHSPPVRTEESSLSPIPTKKTIKPRALVPIAKKASRATANNGTNGGLQIREFKPFVQSIPTKAITGSISTPPLPLIKAYGPCRVCDQLDPNIKQLVCENCGVNVHAHCYGISFEHGIPNNWFCDPCSNDQRPTASTLYSCVLCSSHENNHESSRDEANNTRLSKSTGVILSQNTPTDTSKINIAEALKRTSDNNWIHVKCAIWNVDLKFENVKTLQPVEGISAICFRRLRNAETCQICKSLSGVHTNCFVCRKTIHVGCASRAGYKFGFNIDLTSHDSILDEKTVTIDGKESTMLAVIACPHHADIDNMIETSKVVDTKSNMTAIQLYCQTYKQSENKLTGVMRASTNFDLLTRSESLMFQNGDIKRTFGAFHKSSDNENTTPDAAKNSRKHCAKCETSLTPIWWNDPNDSSKEICHSCYWMIHDQNRYDVEYQSAKRIKLLYESEVEQEIDEASNKTVRVMPQEQGISSTDPEVGPTNPVTTESSLDMRSRTASEPVFSMENIPISGKSSSVSPKIFTPTPLQPPVLSSNHQHHPHTYHPSPLAPHQSSFTQMRYPVLTHPMGMNQYPHQPGMQYTYPNSHSTVMYHPHHNHPGNPPPHSYPHPYSNSHPHPPPLSQHHLTNSIPPLGHNMAINNPYVNPYPQGMYYDHMPVQNMHHSSPLPVPIIRSSPMDIKQLTHIGNESGIMNGASASNHGAGPAESVATTAPKQENDNSKRDIMALNKILS